MGAASVTGTGPGSAERDLRDVILLLSNRVAVLENYILQNVGNGGGGGDFLADGSVSMTGNIAMDQHDIEEVRTLTNTQDLLSINAYVGMGGSISMLGNDLYMSDGDSNTGGDIFTDGGLIHFVGNAGNAGHMGAGDIGSQGGIALFDPFGNKSTWSDGRWTIDSGDDVGMTFVNPASKIDGLGSISSSSYSTNGSDGISGVFYAKDEDDNAIQISFANGILIAITSL